MAVVVKVRSVPSSRCAVPDKCWCNFRNDGPSGGGGGDQFQPLARSQGVENELSEDAMLVSMQPKDYRI
jgi:hypothetical protein